MGVGWSFSVFEGLVWSCFGVVVEEYGFSIRIILFALENDGRILSDFAEVKASFAELGSVLILFDECLGGVNLDSLFFRMFSGNFTFLFVLNNFVLLP